MGSSTKGEDTRPIAPPWLRRKTRQARVTAAALDYEGSITVDLALLEAAGISEFERLQGVDLEPGRRLATYALPASHGSGTTQLNGAAAHLILKGDRVIIMSYALGPEPLPLGCHPRLALVDDRYQIREVHHAPVH